MRVLSIVTALLSVHVACRAKEMSEDEMCEPLRVFVNSVQADQTKNLEFHTIWGGNFNDDPSEAIFAKRCENFGDELGKKVCSYLMKRGAVEFADRNAARAIMCLSPGTRIDSNVSIHEFSGQVDFGTPSKGAFVEIEFGSDSRLGGMVLKLSAEGY